MSNPNPSPETRFGASNKGNPGGKPIGARNALNAKFLRDLSAAFDLHGKSAIEKCALEDPTAFVRVLAALQPKELEITNKMDDINDEQLDAALLAVRAILAAGAGNAPEGAGAGAGQAQELQQAP